MRVILFNLYPYRTQRNQIRKRRVLGEFLAVVSIALVFGFLIRAELNTDLANQSVYLQELSRLENDIAQQVAEIQSKKDRILVLKRQVDALEAVEKESLLVSELLAYLDESIPDQVSIRRFSFDKGVLTLAGNALSVSDLALWLGNLEGEVDLFSKVDLVFVRLKESSRKAGDAVGEHEFEIKAFIQRGRHATST
ncbi:MAG TPA: PilN domain-containing protein [Limnobacter sp.]|nr:PilN domain-containing protein [Limnobacter sp.]